MTSTSSRVRIASAVLGAALVAVFTVQASLAAFSDTTENAGNTFAAGTVILTDDDADVAMFALSGLKPGVSTVNCIEVTYTGSLAANVRLYGAIDAGDGLEAYLDLTIERGDGDCTTFGTATAVWTNGTDGDLGVFMGSETNFTTGSDNWAVAGGGTEMVPYRFTVVQQDNNAAQGLSSEATFTFEAQNT